MGNNFYIRCSQLSSVMAGTFGLTEVQESKLIELKARERGELTDKRGKVLSLTENMINELNELQYKKDNPDLSSGAKTYLKKIVYQEYYNLSKDVYSPVLEHGHFNEPLSINMLNKVLGIGLEKYSGGSIKDNELMLSGTVDVLTDDFIIDIKNPWDAENFNMKRDEIENDYWWQLQGYMELYDREYSYLIYTLNLNKYMVGDEYDHLSDIDRIICKRIDRDRNAIKEYKRRLPAIKAEIDSIQVLLRESFNETKNHLLKIKELAPKPI